MKLVKSLLLGAPAALLVVGAASAADLPSKKAAPATFVKICDAYGAGFFYIPGTDTCLKVGGYVRAEYSIQQRGNSQLTTGAASSFVRAQNQDLTGWRSRGRLDIDARTQTSMGTLRTVLGLRLQNQTGNYNFPNAIGAQNSTLSTTALPTASSYSAIEAAYIQFAGFTVGRAAENFGFMPGATHFFTGGHEWAGFPVGVKQLAYTMTFGGGFSGTIALEDNYDMAASATATKLATTSANYLDVVAYPQTWPALVGNLRLDQAWGSAQIMGAVHKNEATVGSALSTGTYVSSTGWAIGAGVKFNLPMLAAGDQLWLTAAYAEGFKDMAIGFGTGSNNLDQYNQLRGAQRSDTSYSVGLVGGVAKLTNDKVWSVGGALVHYWAPTWRSILGVSYARVQPGTAIALSSTNTSDKGGVSTGMPLNVSLSLIWSPAPNFDIGAELQYRHLKQSVDSTVSATLAANGVTVSPSDWGARLRVQRTF